MRVIVSVIFVIAAKYSVECASGRGAARTAVHLSPYKGNDIDPDFCQVLECESIYDLCRPFVPSDCRKHRMEARITTESMKVGR